MISSINIFGHEIPMYGIMCMIGIAVSVVIALFLAKRAGFEFFDFVLVAIITLVSAFVGAKLLYIIVSWDTVVKLYSLVPWLEASLALLRGGFVFYGGLIGGAIGLIVTLMIKKENVFKWSNIYTLVLPLGHAFGRIGCFLSGCCYGMEYHGWPSVVYTNAIDGNTPIGVPLLAIQLIESFSLFVLFGVLLLLYIKCRYKPAVTLTYIMSYSVIRFVLEFFRGDLERGVVNSLSTSQWISIILFVGTLVYIILEIVKYVKRKRNA